jgi:hypothetical protein
VAAYAYPATSANCGLRAAYQSCHLGHAEQPTERKTWGPGNARDARGPRCQARGGDALDRQARIVHPDHGPFEVHRTGGRAPDDRVADLLPRSDVRFETTSDLTM